MRINITPFVKSIPPRLGNVYPVFGGQGFKKGYMQILIAITNDERGIFLTVDRNGEPVSASSYGLGYIERKPPIAFVPDIDKLDFTMGPLP